MQLSSLLGLPVLDAGSHPVGSVIDVRVIIAGDIQDHPPTPRLLGLVISPHTRASYQGYERSGAKGPALIAALARWRHRGTFVAAWEDIAKMGSDHITLRPGYTRYSATLP